MTDELHDLRAAHAAELETWARRFEKQRREHTTFRVRNALRLNEALDTFLDAEHTSLSSVEQLCESVQEVSEMLAPTPAPSLVGELRLLRDVARVAS